MKRFFVLFCLFLAILGCGERVDLITTDTLKDAVSCFEGAEVGENTYLISLDKTCVDLTLSDFSGIPPAETPAPVEVDWELIATLERDVRQRYWHEFYVEEGKEQPILKAYALGKDFLFVIEHEKTDTIWPIQFIFAQPEIPFDEESDSTRAVLYYPCPPRWYDHWGRETNYIGQPIDRSESGFIADLDLGFPGRDFEHEDNRSQRWVGGTVKFGATRDGQLWNSTYAPHIKEGYILKIYVR